MAGLLDDRADAAGGDRGVRGGRQLTIALGAASLATSQGTRCSAGGRCAAYGCRFTSHSRSLGLHDVRTWLRSVSIVLSSLRVAASKSKRPRALGPANEAAPSLEKARHRNQLSPVGNGAS